MGAGCGPHSPGGEHAKRKEHPLRNPVFTTLAVLVVLLIPLGLAVLNVLFQEEGRVCDPEWERYQQRYD